VPLYAAYGSNMHPEQMLKRAPHSPMAGTGWLPGWRLTFGGEDIGWEGALATIVEDPATRVFVVLYDMTPADEMNLDRWEGSEFGVHKKIRCRVERLSSDTTIDRQRTAAHSQFTPCRACTECQPAAACHAQTRTVAVKKGLTGQ
jgi:hypothetical protein